MEYLKILVVAVTFGSSASIPEKQHKAVISPAESYGIPHLIPVPVYGHGSSSTFGHGRQFSSQFGNKVITPSHYDVTKSIAKKYGLEHISDSHFGGHADSKFSGHLDTLFGSHADSKFGGHINSPFGDRSHSQFGGLDDRFLDTPFNSKQDLFPPHKDQLIPDKIIASKKISDVSLGHQQNQYGTHDTDYGSERKHHQHYHDVPKYSFDYKIKDDYGNHYGHKETRDGYDVKGSYQVLLPDGRTQTVTYYVSGDSGFVAEVTYEGKPHYQEDPHHAPGYHGHNAHQTPGYHGKHSQLGKAHGSKHHISGHHSAGHHKHHSSKHRVPGSRSLKHSFHQPPHHDILKPKPLYKPVLNTYNPKPSYGIISKPKPLYKPVHNTYDPKTSYEIIPKPKPLYKPVHNTYDPKTSYEIIPNPKPLYKPVHNTYDLKTSYGIISKSKPLYKPVRNTYDPKASYEIIPKPKPLYKPVHNTYDPNTSYGIIPKPRPVHNTYDPKPSYGITPSPYAVNPILSKPTPPTYKSTPAYNPSKHVLSSYA